MHAIVPDPRPRRPVGDHARDCTAALFDYHRDYAAGARMALPGEPPGRRREVLLEQCSVPQMGQGFMAYSDFIYDEPGLAPRR